MSPLLFLILPALPVLAEAPEPTELVLPPVVAMPRSAVEERLLADLDRRLVDPAAWYTPVEQEASSFYEGRLFPYVLPTLALASLSRRPGADGDALRARMATLLDLVIPEVARRIGAGSADAIPEVRGHGTWQGQLALALGAWRLAGGDDRYEDLHRRLCEALLAALQARQGAPIDAYPGLVWTFDTVPVLLALRLRDHTHGLPGAEEAIAAHLAWADAHLDTATGLPPNRVYLDRPGVWEGPRGCDIALRIALLAQFDPARAAAMYERFVARFAVDAAGLHGFAEWPDGQTGRPDADSGPVLFGLGMAATGLGLGAVRAAGDAARFARLDAELAAFPRLLPPLLPLVAPQAKALGIGFDTEEYVTGFLFGDAALLWSVTWEPWGVAR